MKSKKIKAVITSPDIYPDSVKNLASFGIEVLFSSGLLNVLEEVAFIRLISATATEEQAKQMKSFVHAFTKRGVPMKTIIDAMVEIAHEQTKGE